jgi:hypothetical protein
VRPSKALFRLKLGRLAMVLAVLGLGSLAMTAPSDRRLALHNAGVAHPEEQRSALHAGPYVPPIAAGALRYRPGRRS